MQRYLTGKSIAQSRLSLLFNAVAKIPMQFFILFIGAMVFVFYLFVQPPVLFQQARAGRACRARRSSSRIEAEYDRAFEHRKQAALALAEAHHAGDPRGGGAAEGGVPRGAEGARRRAQRGRRSWWSKPAAKRASATPTTSSSRS